METKSNNLLTFNTVTAGSGYTAIKRSDGSLAISADGT